MVTELIDVNQDSIKCQKCSRVVTAGADGTCPGCNELICVVCGCTTSHACPGGCYWTQPGVCSQCDAATADKF
ncbi:MAG TPA: hypothetical protein VF599_12635 [Pyrinomonadaceae bacterium]|jgi:hypothetical protein